MSIAPARGGGLHDKTDKLLLLVINREDNRLKGDRQTRWIAQQLCVVGGRQGPTEQKSLYFIAAMRAQVGKLSFRLDPLSDYLEL